MQLWEILQIYYFLMEMLILAIKQHIDLMLAESSHFQYRCRILEQKLLRDITAQKDYYKVLLT